MTILIDQPQFVTGFEVEEKKIPVTVGEKELALDGGFVVPQTNSFGQTFRNYDAEGERQQGVENFYRINHISQTYDFVKRMREEYGKLNRVEMSIWACCELLNNVVDESDPDLDEPQIQHLLQTAEAIRKDYPNEDWLHLTGLIHDLGKVLLHPSFGELPQWAVVGDTFPVGCAFDESIVHHKVAKKNKTTLPSAALFIIRYHSFNALHMPGAYRHLINEEDNENLKWLQIFQKYDLYSKSRVRIDVEKVKPYYLSLIEKVLVDQGLYVLPVFAANLRRQAPAASVVLISSKQVDPFVQPVSVALLHLQVPAAAAVLLRLKPSLQMALLNITVLNHPKDPGVGGRKAVVTAGGLVKCPHCVCCKPPLTPNSCCKCCDSSAENTARYKNGFP
ncbi:hypothetical protein GH714_035813 [Hevea brasiliensis]|uniref:Inositol oxygenase n=1 Tax=Hevea brasiliensis TaxID=3981 RepID=A0A6A6NEB9_HEVBR|nr:hypothetical protein GH714_035813 [Hevea brasiliensis]